MKIVNYIEKIESMIEKNEKVIDRIIIDRMVKSVSTYIYLTNKRIIFFSSSLFKVIDSIDLANISAISYNPKSFSSSGIIKVIQKKGSTKMITPLFVSEIKANEFIRKVEKELERLRKK